MEILIAVAALAILIVGGFVAVFIIEAQNRRRAWQRYEFSLEALRRDPTNAAIRQRAVELGRLAMSSGRNGEGIEYDELRIRNDIDAACAGAVRFEERNRTR